MVRAPFRLSLGGRSLVNRNPLYASRGQLERVSVPFLLVAPPNWRSRLRPDLLHDPGFEKLDYRLLGLAALRTCRRNQAMIVAVRGSAQQHKLRVIEFDGHDLNACVSGAGQSRALTDASPDRSDCPGEGFFRRPQRMRSSIHMLLFRPNASPFLERERCD